MLLLPAGLHRVVMQGSPDGVLVGLWALVALANTAVSIECVGVLTVPACIVGGDFLGALASK